MNRTECTDSSERWT